MRRSQQARRSAPEADALRLGVGWSDADLERPYVMVESVAGDSHPGSVHLAAFAAAAADAARAEAAVASYTCTDMCDGIAQGTDGMDYSLPSRDLIAAAVEMHANSGYYDALVLVSGCDKAVPAHLMAAARLDLPTVHVPGGSMPPGDGDVTVDQIGTLAAAMRRGELDPREYAEWVKSAVPSCGSCAFMGTALTSQVMSEVLGLALPHTAVAPSSSDFAVRLAAEAGRQVARHLEKGLTARRFVTAASVRNAMIVHAAIGGSTNFVIHLLAIAGEAGIAIDLAELQKVNDSVPYLLDARPAGRFPANLFWHAGGAPRLMRELSSFLDLDCLCGTGQTWGQELTDREASRFFELTDDTLTRRGLVPTDIIRPVSEPLQPRGGLAVLGGNLAPDGAVVKRSAVHPDAMRIVGPARVFERQEDALQSITDRAISPGEILVIRNEGPRGSGMPEQYYVTSAIAADPTLARSVALVTDGRFSGASLGPCIGHVSPESAVGGPLAWIDNGDVIEVDIDGGRLNVLGRPGGELSVDAGQLLVESRQRERNLPKPALSMGYLAVYRALADSAMAGARMRGGNA